MVYGDAVGDADSDGDAVSSCEGDGSPETDGAAELDAGSEGSGTGVGSGMKRDGTARIDRTITKTKMPMTVRIQGRANRSPRAGSAPRYPGSLLVR